MNLQECYAKMNGDYEDAKKRLMSDRLVEKFMLKFPQDPTMGELRQALAAGDYESAFRAAHTLKGVAGNLSFEGLRAAASALTERLRNDKTCPEAELVRGVEDAYGLVTGTLEQYLNDRQ